jgi:hypothetical protein
MKLFLDNFSMNKYIIQNKMNKHCNRDRDLTENMFGPDNKVVFFIERNNTIYCFSSEELKHLSRNRNGELKSPYGQIFTKEEESDINKIITGELNYSNYEFTYEKEDDFDSGRKITTEADTIPYIKELGIYEQVNKANDEHEPINLLQNVQKYMNEHFSHYITSDGKSYPKFELSSNTENIYDNAIEYYKKLNKYLERYGLKPSKNLIFIVNGRKKSVQGTIYDGKEVYSGLDITSFSDETVIPMELTKLSLSSNLLSNLKCVPSNRLVKFHEGLIELDLSGNKIKNIEGIVFPDTLNTLELSENNINSLRNVYFGKNLKDLFITENKLNSLAGCNFGEQLNQIDLSHNLIKTLDDANFPDTLTTLVAENNLISSIDNFKFPESLEEMILQRNKIKNIDKVNFRNLKMLDVSDNKITSINMKLIKFPEDFELYISENDIKNIDKIKFPDDMLVHN